MSNTPKTILIIGASRGLGLGLTTQFLERRWSVIATMRHEGPGLTEAKARNGDALRVEVLDINVPEQAAALRRNLADARLDIVFVNAGVMDDKRPVGTASNEEFTRLMITNALSPMQMIEVFAPLVVPQGVIAAMSSGLGSVAGNTSGGYEIYRASKAALNTMLRSYAARDPKRAVLALSPGWVRTDMGGSSAALDVEMSARGIAEVLVTHLGRPGSAFLNYHGKPVPW